MTRECCFSLARQPCCRISRPDSATDRLLSDFRILSVLLGMSGSCRRNEGTGQRKPHLDLLQSFGCGKPLDLLPGRLEPH